LKKQILAAKVLLTQAENVGMLIVQITRTEKAVEGI
jgi:hypothetical protein